MKRFTLITIGDNFEFQGDRYSKTGPLTAINLSNNKQRMIPRSAMVKPVTAGAAVEEERSEKALQLDGERVREAFEHYHNGCIEWLTHAEKEMSDETAAQFRQALEGARRRLLEDLGIS